MAEQITKEDLKRSDLFIQMTDKIIEWLEKNWKSIGAILLAILLAGVAYVGYDFKRHHDESSAQAQLYSLKLDAERLENSFKAREEVNKSEEDFNKHFSTLFTKYTDFFASYRKTQSEKMAYIQFSDFLSRHKYLERAEEKLTKILSETERENFYYGLISMKLSQVQMDRENFSDAIRTLEKVSGLPEHKHVHAESLLRIGLCHKQLEDLEKAKQYFERVSRDFAETESARSAKLFLRYLAVKG